MSWISNITSNGISFAKTKSQRRNIILSNYVALIAFTANLLLLIGRYFYGLGNTMAGHFLIPGSILFLLPVYLNRIGYINGSRLLLCWLAPAFLVYGSFIMTTTTPLYESSMYVGVRYMMLAATCFPFIVYDLRERRPFLLALAGPYMLLIFFDPIMNLLSVGYKQVGLREVSYYFNNVRAIVSVMIIGSGFLFLKILVERNVRINEELIHELEEKNKLLERQTENKLKDLNEQLQEQLHQLQGREFILNESQRIAKVGNWEYRVSDKSLFWSDEMYSIFGLDRNERITPESMSTILLKEHRELVDNAIARVLQDAIPVDLTVQAKTPFGHMKWVRVYAYPIRDERAVRGICHDVTFYKEAEENIRVSENKYRTLFEHASDGIMITDFNGRFLEVNSTLCNMLGYTKAEMLQLNLADLMEPDELALNPIRFAQLLMGEQIFNERKLTHKSGRVIHVEASIKRFGEQAIMAITRDTTDMRKAQRDIQISEAKFRSAFEESAIGMALCDMEGNWIKVNREFCHITGYSNAELLKMSFLDMTYAEDISRDLTILNDFIQGKSETVQLEKRYVHKQGHVIWVHLNVSIIKDNQSNPLYFVCQVEDITAVQAIEKEKEHTRYLLNERIKELTTLYRTSQILNNDQKNVLTALEEITNLIPSGWQFPEVAGARITIDDKTFVTSNFKDSVHRQRADFQTNFGTKGAVEVTYPEDTAHGEDGLFLSEEYDLINMIAEMIRIYLIRRHEADALIKSQANLTTTINNSDTLIWSLDKDLCLITFNEPFARHMLVNYGVEIKEGMNLFQTKSKEEVRNIWEVNDKVWRYYYEKALAGEKYSVELATVDKLFQYSFSPIYHGKAVIGLSIFGNNITEQRRLDRQLAEANKKIGELKLMALRSVMSPHFIFNVLNSIQFFIARNDRENAINYLSTFSKLIRNVLTHSVDNRIKLTDEIELLKNYVMLEMTRFENKFDFDIYIDPNMDLESIEIPSLLIQPYVENAILHGLYNKMGNGKLKVSIKEEDDHVVVFEVEDDGIGRKAARSLRSKNFPSHQSMGINLTEERLKLIAQDNETSVQIEDLEREGQACGTRVRIRIKYELA